MWKRTYDDAFERSQEHYGYDELDVIADLRSRRDTMKWRSASARAWWARVEEEHVRRPAEARRLARLMSDLRLSPDDVFVQAAREGMDHESAIVAAAWDRATRTLARRRALLEPERPRTILPTPSRESVERLRAQAVTLDVADLVRDGAPHAGTAGWTGEDVAQRISDLHEAFLDTELPEADTAPIWEHWLAHHHGEPLRTLWLCEELAFRGLDLYDVQVALKGTPFRDPFVAFGMLLPAWLATPGRWIGPREWSKHAQWREEWKPRAPRQAGEPEDDAAPRR